MSKSIRNLFLLMILSFVILGFWNSVPIISQSVHAVLDPTAGKLLNFNVNIGMIVFSAIISLGLTLIQKYTTDQEALREIKKEQKLLQEEMKKYKNHPEKLLEMQKKSMQTAFSTMDITLRPLMYTSLPVILFFRWFGDFFTSNPIKIFGFMHWLLAYIIFSMIFTTIFRKVFNVA